MSFVYAGAFYDLEKRVRDLELREHFPTPESVEGAVRKLEILVGMGVDHCGTEPTCRLTGNGQSPADGLTEILRYAVARGWALGVPGI